MLSSHKKDNVLCVTPHIKLIPDQNAIIVRSLAVDSEQSAELVVETDNTVNQLIIMNDVNDLVAAEKHTSMDVHEAPYSSRGGGIQRHWRS